jgi:hypothetical protein
MPLDQNARRHFLQFKSQLTCKDKKFKLNFWPQEGGLFEKRFLNLFLFCSTRARFKLGCFVNIHHFSAITRTR